MIKTQAWIPAQATQPDSEYHHQYISVLKPNYFWLEDDGTLTLLDDLTRFPWGFSASNLADIKLHSLEQYVTVGAGHTGLQTLVADSAKVTTVVNTLRDFAVTTNITGIEIDFEEFSLWSTATYNGYRTLLSKLKTALNAKGKCLMVCAPPVQNDQSPLKFRYQDIPSLVDYFCVMAYDYHFDVPNAPVAPTAWVQRVIDYAKSKVPITKLVIGINAYGYTRDASGKVTNRTYQELLTAPGREDATLAATAPEMHWDNDGTHYCFVTPDNLKAKYAQVEASGILGVSVWHLGGNVWVRS